MLPGRDFLPFPQGAPVYIPQTPVAVDATASGFQRVTSVASQPALRGVVLLRLAWRPAARHPCVVGVRPARRTLAIVAYCLSLALVPVPGFFCHSALLIPLVVSLVAKRPAKDVFISETRWLTSIYWVADARGKEEASCLQEGRRLRHAEAVGNRRREEGGRTGGGGASVAGKMVSGREARFRLMASILRSALGLRLSQAACSLLAFR